MCKKIFVLLLFLAGFYLRIRDITYGLPDGSNIYHKVPYFSDEVAVVEDFKKLIVFLHTKEPSYLINWSYTIFGRLLSFLPYALLVVISKPGFIGKDLRVIEVLKISQITVAGRIISILSSFFSLIVIYKLLKLLKAKFVFILLALFYIIFNAADIMVSLQAKSNTLMNLFILLSLYSSLLWLEGKKGKTKYILIAAAFSGLAMSSRINGGLSSLIILFSFLVQSNFNLRKIFLKKKELFLVLTSFLFAFIVSCPTIFLEPRLVLRIWQHAGSGSLTTKINWPLLFNNLKYLMGGRLGTLIFSGIIFLSLIFFKKMRRIERTIVFWLYLYLLASIFTSAPLIRYLYPLMNIYVLVFYIVITYLFSYLKPRFFYLIFPLTGVALLILLINFFLGLSFLDFYQGKDVRVEAADFVNSNISEGSSIGTYLYPNFYGPYVPLNYDKFDLVSYRAYEELGKKISNKSPDYIVVEGRGYTQEFIDYFGIRNNYQLVKVFKRDLKNFGPFVFNNYKCPQATVVRIFKKII